MWMSPQGFDDDWMEEWYGILRQEPAWLTGVVFGPWVRDNLPDLRRKVPKRYAMRFYPDITHSLHSQYPVPDWDVVFARTAGREGINPRPLDQAAVFRLLQPHAETGFLTYSEGCNDDVNKFVWSALGWDPEADMTTILREYSRYFIGDEFADDFAQGILALERNWRGPLLANEEVFTTLQQFQAMERAAPPHVLANWRFQQALYRAYYDGYNRARLLYETALEEEAMDVLRRAPRSGSLAAMTQAEGVLERAVSRPVASEWRARVFEMAEALYQSIRMQLSVPRYKAIGLRRGANLDSIDVPLNNRKWLLHRFGQLRTFSDEGERLRGIKEILSWTDPGPGGYYDDLGNLSLQPHLVRGPGFAKDPASLVSSLVGFTLQGPDEPWRTSWWQHAETLNNTPLEMRYTGLDRSAEYRVRVVYALENTVHPIRLVADEQFEIHPFRKKDVPPKPVEFDIPKQATEDGSLVLKWYRKPGLGGSGRGCQVAEVWLIKKQ